MAFTLSHLPLSLHTPHNPHPANHTSPRVPPITNRRQLLFSLTFAPALIAISSPSQAADIPLFGIRKSLRKAEEEAEAIVKEGFEAAEKGIEAVEAAEKGIESAVAAEAEAVSYSQAAQAVVVAGAEVVGVLIASYVVNGILGPEAQKS